MKIISFEPRSLATPADLDQSKLAYHVKGIRPAELGSQKHGIVLIGFADDTGVKNVGGRPGAKDGPAATRHRLYKFTLGPPRLPVYDLGDLSPGATIQETHEWGRLLVKDVIAAGHFPIVIGGGHDLAFPHSLAALEAFGAATFFNIDAHLDVRPTDRGITSGSPWYLLREHPAFGRASRIVEFGLQPHCNAASLVDYAERKKFELHWLAAIRAGKKPADALFAGLLRRHLGAKSHGLVSLDIDSVSWAEAPGCSAPQTEGFSAAEAIRMSYASGLHTRVKSFGVFELCPALDPDGRTANLVAHCVAACIRGLGDRGRARKK